MESYIAYLHEYPIGAWVVLALLLMFLEFLTEGLLGAFAFAAIVMAIGAWFELFPAENSARLVIFGSVGGALFLLVRIVNGSQVAEAQPPAPAAGQVEHADCDPVGCFKACVRKFGRRLAGDA